MRILQYLMLTLWLSGVALAQDPPVPEPPQPEEVETDDAYLGLLAEYDDAQAAHKLAIRSERDPQKRRALRAETAEKQLLPKFEALVEAGDGRGWMWIALHVRGAGLDRATATERRATAWRSLAHDYLEAPWLGEAIGLIKRHRADIGRAQALEYLEHILAKSPLLDSQARAAYQLSQVFSSSEKEAELARKKELDALLEEKYADTPLARELAAAEEERAARQAASQGGGGPAPAPRPVPKPTVVIGQKAPALVGKNVDAEEVGLDDVAGEVTVVCFCGFYQPASRKLLGELAKLDVELGEKPFTVLGVSTGDSSTKAKEWLGKLAPAVRSWPFAIQGLADAPLSDAWGVDEYPTMFVLDGEGRVAGRARRLAEARKIVERELAKRN